MTVFFNLAQDEDDALRNHAHRMDAAQLKVSLLPAHLIAALHS
jgi:hypothetical protein